MSRYIDADALKSEFEWLLSVVNPCSRDDVLDLIRRIDNSPTVDVVKVVRCKDCAYRDEEPCDDNLLWCNRIGNAVLPFGYCSDGIRRLGNE